jgi:hypothetical protein
VGRPSDYTQETASLICERLVEGESLRSICRDEAMPAIRTVFLWLGKHEAFMQQYAHARESQADTYADEIIDIADDGSGDWIIDSDGNKRVDQDCIARSRLRVDSRKWIASKLKSKKYGEKVEQTHVGDKERPIVLAPIDADL